MFEFSNNPSRMSWKTAGQSFKAVTWKGLFSSESKDHNENSFDDEKNPEHQNALDAAAAATAAKIRGLLGQHGSLLRDCCIPVTNGK